MNKTFHTMCKSALLLTLALAASAASAQVVWNGGSGQNWSTSANWVGGAVPDSTADVKFYDLGSTTTIGTTTSIVDLGGAFGGTINSLQFGVTNGYHTMQIASNQTLTVQGALTEGTEATMDTLKTNMIVGAGGALVLNNTSANITVRQGPVASTSTANRTTLDMSGLDTFSATVARVMIGQGSINRATGRLILAKTNTITASSTTVPAVDVGDSGSNNGGGSSLVLGQTNAIFADSIGINRNKESGSSISFNTNFSGNVAYFRGKDGVSRIGFFTVNDGGTGSGTFGGSATVDFSKGAVDILVDTNIIARANSYATSTAARTQSATVTYNGGTINANLFQVGINTAGNTNWAQATVNVNGSTLLVVNNALELGRTAATAVAGGDNTRGTLTINGGTVWANAIVANFTSSNNAILLTNGTLVVTNTAGPGINTFAVTNSTLGLGVTLAGTPLVVTNLTTGGTTNYINIIAVPIVPHYPYTFNLIKYTGAIAGAGYNFGLNTLAWSPGNPYQGYVTNVPADQMVYFVLTNGPTPPNTLVWSGIPNGSWTWGDGSTQNWLIGTMATNFNQGDFALFDDTATGTTTVSLDTTVQPGSLTVNNNTKTYTFGGSGNLTGVAVLNKQGTGTLVLDHNGTSDFTGGVSIQSGTVQVGNSDYNGNLPSTGAINNNGTLVFKRLDTVTQPNVISGSGSLTQNGTSSGVLQLSGGNTFTGPVTVASGTLQTGSASALGATNGATTVASGATLDVNGQNLGYEQIIVSGAGVGGNGAIVNSGASQSQALRNVTLQGDTSFGGSARWDIRGAPASLLTGGQPYKITKVGANQVSLVAVTNIDPALGDIDVQQGIFAVQTSTAQLGDSTRTLTVESGATLDVYSLTTPLNKNIVLNGDGADNTIYAESGNSTIAGPITLNGSCIMSVSGTSLTLSNNVTGSGSLTKYGNGILNINGTTSFTGGLNHSGGTLLVNGTLAGPVTTQSLTTMGGNGTCTGLVDANYFVTAGGLGSIGTMTFAGGLNMDGYATFLFDLTATNTASGGVNDLIQVNGDLNVNGAWVYLNPVQGRLQAGRYRVLNYTGSLIGSGFSAAQATNSTRYNFAVDTSVAHEVGIIVSGSASDLTWASTSSTNWDIASSGNWVDSSANSTQFYNGDTVAFNDSVSGVATNVSIQTNVTVMPWAITNISSANNFTIAGPGRIGGSTGIYKSGSSTLTVLSSNTFTGPVVVQSGTLQVGNSGALGTTNSGTTLASGSTLDFGGSRGVNDINLGFEAVTISGSGIGNNGAIINSATNTQQNALRLVTLTGDTVFGGIGRWDIRSQASNTDVASSNNAVLSTSGQPYNITKIGTNTMAIVGVLVDPALGNINLQQGLLSIEHSSTMGDPAKTVTVSAGAALQFYQNWPSNQLNKVLILNGDGANPGLISASGNNVFVGPITLNSNCVLNMSAGSLTLTNNTLGGSGGLIKVGTNTLTLAGVVSYTGNTLISTGRVALVGSASLASSTNLILATNTTLDVSALTDPTLTLSGVQVLSGIGTVAGNLVVGPTATLSPGLSGVGLLTVTNAVTLGGTIAMDISGATNDVLRTGTIAYGGTLSLNFTAGALVNGSSLKLFNASSYSGSFASILPATPGAGLKWDTSKLAASGILGVVNAVIPVPTFSSWTVTSSGLVMSGTNGTANASFNVLSSTNVALPLNEWTTNASGTFDANGNFIVTNAVNSGLPAQFFRLQTSH
jgi:autotransporter-associated beta strand protein